MAQNNIVTIEHLSKVYTERQIFNDTDFSINEGEKVALIGVNGTGKSTLLRIIAGLEEPDEGSMAMRRELEIRFLPQTPSFDPEDTILEAILHDNEGHQHVWDLETEAKKFLSKLGENDFSRKIGELSGGQKKRVALASTLLSTADLLILDEPTNHLDGAMSEWLEDYLKRYKGTLLMVTHDRYLMQTLGCPILYLEDGKATFYQNFQKLHDRDTSKQPEPAKQEDKPQKAGYGKEQRRRRAEVRTRLKALETEIEELGAHIVELENEINDPEVLRDHLLLRDKCDELDDSRFHQQELYDEWEKLAEEQDRMDAESDS